MSGAIDYSEMRHLLRVPTLSLRPTGPREFVEHRVCHRTKANKFEVDMTKTSTRLTAQSLLSIRAKNTAQLASVRGMEQQSNSGH